MKKSIMTLLVLASITAFSTTQAQAATTHKVKSGDTMYEIAVEHGVTLNKLVKVNPQVENVNMIYIGQRINVDGKNSAAKQVKTSTTAVANVSANSQDIDLLARLVRAEAQGESYAGKVAVAKVVLNRVASNKFPDTISTVIYQRGQFSPVSNGMINKQADSESTRAAQEALEMGGNPDSALFFYNPRTANTSWIGGRPIIEVIGNHVFAK